MRCWIYFIYTSYNHYPHQLLRECQSLMADVVVLYPACLVMYMRIIVLLQQLKRAE